MIFTLSSAFACFNEACAQEVSKDQADLSVSVKTKDASSKDAKDGYILLNITGGEAPYTIDIHSQTSAYQRKESTGKLELKKLLPGSFIFIIVDNSKKMIQQSVTISSEN
ncbi:MAG: hypothetical protein J7604_20820 [Sporocytophaga sp.]|uniref:hypothetical protein n=1 Tax=Sporocytophaga sp. TaxID=2231183 RepID=UPI001B2D0E3C|nr:hypothetical protein [Sporocytophaga sp.]MBO9702667.1 hypothetical protein [Sporocytophaga sp.]